MPSSFTPLLKLELPATGELSGTWGTTVNNAITTPLSEAVAGTTTITVGGSDYTLSNGDGSAANEARKMFIVATGTPGASRNVICPAASKFYVFRNDTNQTLTLKTLSGTGIAVPAGQYRFLYCDGTNVVETFNAMASLTLGTALAAASGGTGQSSYTAGDLLYATGTTALSKLGIGASTTILTSSGTAPQWTAASSVAIGTATNLAGGAAGSVPYQSGAATTTFLGIGAANTVMTSSGTAPQWSTALTGLTGVSTTTATLSGNLTLSGGTANGVLYLDGSKVATSGSALTFDGARLTVNSGATSEALRLNATADTYLSFQRSGTGTAYIQSSTGGMLLWNQENTAIQFGVNNAEQMRLTSTGLGIGTSSPGAKLDVNGASYLGGNIQTISGSTLYNSTGDLYVRAGTSGALRLGSGGSNDHMLLDSSGNLGLGVTPSAWLASQKALEVSGWSVNAASLTSSLATNAYVNASSQWIYKATGFATRYDNVSGQHQWYTAASGTAGNAITFTQAMTLLGTSDVQLLLGTTSSAYGTAGRGLVEVNGSSTALIAVKTGDTARGYFAASTSITELAAVGASQPLVFTTNAAERARITSGGDLLVGTTTSSARLSVTQADPAGGIIAAISNFSGVTTNNGCFLVLDNSGRQAWRIGGAAASQDFSFSSNAGGGYTERMRLDSSGNLGIGTSSPTNRLSVAGSTGTIASFTNGATADFSIICGSSITSLNAGGANILAFQTGGNERARIDSSGNLGLGVTPSAWGNAYKALQVSSGGSYAASSNAAFWYSNAYNDNTNWRYVTSTSASGYTQFGGSHTWYTAPSGTAGNAISFTQAMTLDASGNLAVGTTTTTSARLRVDGSNGIFIAGNGANGYNVLQAQNDAATGISVGVSGSTAAGWSQALAHIGTTSNSPLVLGTNSTERARIPAAGGMVVGTAALATSATDGFLYVPTCAGTPTGTPTTQTGTAPIVVDTTNNKLYFYSGGQWRDAGP